MLEMIIFKRFLTIEWVSFTAILIWSCKMRCCSSSCDLMPLSSQNFPLILHHTCPVPSWPHPWLWDMQCWPHVFPPFFAFSVPLKCLPFLWQPAVMNITIWLALLYSPFVKPFQITQKDCLTFNCNTNSIYRWPSVKWNRFQSSYYL